MPNVRGWERTNDGNKESLLDCMRLQASICFNRVSRYMNNLVKNAWRNLLLYFTWWWIFRTLGRDQMLDQNNWFVYCPSRAHKDSLCNLGIICSCSDLKIFSCFLTWNVPCSENFLTLVEKFLFTALCLCFFSILVFHQASWF